MRTKRFLTPPAFQRFDEWLLKNRPETWSARAHFVSWYSAIMIVLLAVIAFMMPDDPRTDSNIPTWLMFTSVIAIIAIVGWLIYLLRFNVFKRYGNTSGLGRLKTFLLYFASTGMIMLILLVHPLVESIRAENRYPVSETVRDINEINTTIAQLEYERLPNWWRRDSLTIRDTLPGHYLREEGNNDGGHMEVDYVLNSDTGNHQTTVGYLDTAGLRNRKETADSMRRINDSVYVFYTCPNFAHLDTYQREGITAEKILDSKGIYDKVLKEYHPNVPALIKRLKELETKYHIEDRWDRVYVQDTINMDLQNRISYRYHVSNMGSSFRNISERRDWVHTNDLQAVIRMWFYSSLLLALLIFIFRHSTPKTFFVSLLSLAIIFILTALFMALNDFNLYGFLGMVLFWFIAFTGSIIGVFWSSTRSMFLGIGANLFTLVAGFMPLILTAFYIQILEQQRREIGEYGYRKENYDWLVYAEISGMILLLVLIPTFIHKAYRKWYASPEN